MFTISLDIAGVLMTTPKTIPSIYSIQTISMHLLLLEEYQNHTKNISLQRNTLLGLVNIEMIKLKKFHHVFMVPLFLSISIGKMSGLLYTSPMIKHGIYAQV